MHVNVSLLSHRNCNISSGNKLGINAKHCTCLSLYWCSGAVFLPPWRRKEVDCQSTSTWLSSMLGSQVGLKQLEVCCHLQRIEATTHRALTAALKWIHTHVMLRCSWRLKGPQGPEELFMFTSAMMRFYPISYLWLTCQVHTQIQGPEMGHVSLLFVPYLKCSVQAGRPPCMPTGSKQEWVSLHLPLHLPRALTAALHLILSPMNEI